MALVVRRIRSNKLKQRDKRVSTSTDRKHFLRNIFSTNIERQQTKSENATRETNSLAFFIVSIFQIWQKFSSVLFLFFFLWVFRSQKKRLSSSARDLFRLALLTFDFDRIRSHCHFRDRRRNFVRSICFCRWSIRKSSFGDSHFLRFHQPADCRHANVDNVVSVKTKWWTTEPIKINNWKLPTKWRSPWSSRCCCDLLAKSSKDPTTESKG